MDIDEFFAAADDVSLKALDRAYAVLWWNSQCNPSEGMTARAICDVIERHGHPSQNASRLQAKLAADRDTSKAKGGAWRLHPRKRSELDVIYGPMMASKVLPGPSDSVLPRQLFQNTRGYLERVVNQLNISYDTQLYDCCAVMCRRVLETLLIELYEGAGRATEIKGADGNFLMFQGLLSYFEKDSSFHPSRNALKGLRDFKRLGDLSAHNRRFNAVQPDIDKVSDGLRVAAEELLNLARLRAA
jgi:hypothetical protein